MRFRRDLEVEIFHAVCDHLDLIPSGGSEKLEGDVIGESPLFQGAKESLSILLPRLVDIPDDHHGGVEMVTNPEDILRQQLRGAIGRLLSIGITGESIGRSPTGPAVVRTATTGKDRRDGIFKPVGKGNIARHVTILHDLFHNVPVVYGNMIHRFRHITQRVDPHLPLFPPCHVRDISGRHIFTNRIQ